MDCADGTRLDNAAAIRISSVPAEEALRESEAKYRALVETTGTGYVFLDELGHVTDANQEYVRLTGHQALEEILGRQVTEWTAPYDRARNAAEVALCFARGSVRNLEIDYIDFEGRITPIEINATVYSTPAGPRIVTLCKGIAERRKAERALRESEARLRAIFERASVGMFDSAPGGNFRHANPAFVRFIGYTEEELRAFSFRRITHPDDLPSCVAGIQECLDGLRTHVEMEKRYVRRDGRTVWGHVSVALVRDESSAPMTFIGVVQDITERKHAEDERRRLEAEVQHAQKLEGLGRLAGGIAHDMNNVLAAIEGMASMLELKYGHDAALRTNLGTIMNASMRGRDLVKSLTEFGRKGIEEPRPLDLNHIVRREIELLRHTTFKKIDLTTTLEEPLPRIQGDSSSLGNILMNLSVNAFDAMPDGGTLRFETRSLPNGLVELRVTDTGSGMTPEVLARAAEPFFTTKPLGKGTGLGLSSVYGAMKAHGGTMELRSEERGGTVVSLRFPALGGPETTVDGGSVGGPRSSPGSLRILLVDDDELIRASFPPLVEILGHEVASTAADGDEALRLIDGGLEVDVVVLDQNMPGLSGVEVLDRLRARRPRLPVVLSTGYLDETVAARVKNRPHVWLLMKPYSIDEVGRALDDAMKESGSRASASARGALVSR